MAVRGIGPIVLADGIAAELGKLSVIDHDRPESDGKGNVVIGYELLRFLLRTHLARAENSMSPEAVKKQESTDFGAKR